MDETGFKRSYIPRLCLLIFIAAPVAKAQLDGNARTNEQFHDLFSKEMKELDRIKNSCKWGTYYSVELQTCKSCDLYCPNGKVTEECRKCAAFSNEKKFNETTLRLNEADDTLSDKIKSQQVDIQKLRFEMSKQQNLTQAEISQLKEELQVQKQINQDQCDEIAKLISDREKDQDKSQMIKAKLAELKVENKTLRAETGRLNSENEQIRQIAIFALILSIVILFSLLALVIYVRVKIAEMRQEPHYVPVNPVADAAAEKEDLEENPQPNVPQEFNVAQPDEFARHSAHVQIDVPH